MAFSFSNFFGTEEMDEPTSQTQSMPRSTASASNMNTKRTAAKVVDMAGRSAAPTHIALFEPRIYSDVKGIAQQLIENQAVIVNFEKLDDESSKRIVDFLTGTVFAISGEIKRVGETIFLCTPNNFEISGDLSTRFDQNSSF
ncbi:cell division protein SepF [Furfurilactobacillus sp. WILCCON 0119]